ncbi:hypothetical protein SLS55_007684 [Diplodia seriata]|uniref:Uncharacterized protein n=1 Tax=Diplodia seriata TaxID=420778 RepID=A0ABR3C9L8_9PEZI
MALPQSRPTDPFSAQLTKENGTVLNRRAPNAHIGNIPVPKTTPSVIKTFSLYNRKPAPFEFSKDKKRRFYGPRSNLAEAALSCTTKTTSSAPSSSSAPAKSPPTCDSPTPKDSRSLLSSTPVGYNNSGAITTTDSATTYEPVVSITGGGGGKKNSGFNHQNSSSSNSNSGTGGGDDGASTSSELAIEQLEREVLALLFPVATAAPPSSSPPPPPVPTWSRCSQNVDAASVAQMYALMREAEEEEDDDDDDSTTTDSAGNSIDHLDRWRRRQMSTMGTHGDGGSQQRRHQTKGEGEEKETETPQPPYNRRGVAHQSSGPPPAMRLPRLPPSSLGRRSG